METSIKSRLRSAHTSGTEDEQEDFGCGKYETVHPGFSRVPPDDGSAPEMSSTGGLLRSELGKYNTMEASAEILAESVAARTEMHADPDEGVVSSTEEDGPEERTIVCISNPDPRGTTVNVSQRPGTPITPIDDTVRENVDTRRDDITQHVLQPHHGGNIAERATSMEKNVVELKERFVADEEGLWVTFDVPPSHHMYGKFFPTTKENVPHGYTIGHAQDRPPFRNPSKVDSDLRGRHGSLLQPGKDDTSTPEFPPAGRGTVRPEKDVAYFNYEVTRLKNEIRRLKMDKATDRSGPGRMRWRTDTEMDSAYDTVIEADSRQPKKRGYPNPYTTDYETCRETDLDIPNREDSSRRSKTSRRRRAKTPSEKSSDAPSFGNDQSMAEMFQRYLKTTLDAVLEEKLKQTASSQQPGGKPPAAEGLNCPNGGETPPRRDHEPATQGDGQPVKLEISDVRSLAPPYPMCGMNVPAGAGMPLSAMTKFDGQYWEEFIEYFESVADANMWGEKERLTFLLMSIEGKARAYAKSEKGVPQTYANVKARLHSRYSQHEPAFSVRNQLRDIRRAGGERLEDFADRLQEVAQRGNLDAWERDDLFYHAFIQAVKGTPKMQVHLEKQYRARRATGKDTKLSDLLAWVREYREKSPASAVQTASVLVCKPVTQRKVKLSHEDEEVKTEVAQEEGKVLEEKEERKRTKHATNTKDLNYALNELEWVKKVIKENKLHYKQGKGKKGFQKKPNKGEADPKKQGAKVNSHSAAPEESPVGPSEDSQE